jgi:hypothetical protein
MKIRLAGNRVRPGPCGRLRPTLGRGRGDRRRPNPEKLAKISDQFGLHVALAARMSDLPPSLLRSVTWDQGTEMARHTEITAVLGGCRSTSATRTHRGNAGRTRTPTACCASTSPREPVLPQGNQGTDLSVHHPQHLRSPLTFRSPLNVSSPDPGRPVGYRGRRRCQRSSEARPRGHAGASVRLDRLLTQGHRPSGGTRTTYVAVLGTRLERVRSPRRAGPTTRTCRCAMHDGAVTDEESTPTTVRERLTPGCPTRGSSSTGRQACARRRRARHRLGHSGPTAE